MITNYVSRRASIKNKYDCSYVAPHGANILLEIICTIRTTSILLFCSHVGDTCLTIARTTSLGKNCWGYVETGSSCHDTTGWDRWSIISAMAIVICSISTIPDVRRSTTSSSRYKDTTVEMFQVGINGGIEGARYSEDKEQNHKQFTLSTRWPTRVAKVNSQQAVVTDAKMMYRFSPEIMYSYGRFAVIGQYSQ